MTDIVKAVETIFSQWRLGNETVHPAQGFAAKGQLFYAEIDFCALGQRGGGGRWVRRGHVKKPASKSSRRGGALTAPTSAFHNLWVGQRPIDLPPVVVPSFKLGWG